MSKQFEALEAASNEPLASMEAEAKPKAVGSTSGAEAIVGS